MKTKNACILLLAALALTACKYDDSALWEQVNQNTERIAALEAWQVETNTNIQSLQTLLSTADYITAVTPVMENEVEVGYTISFLNSDPVTIYHGQKGDKGDTGATGATPQIGVTQGEDGNWYWTLNGELLTDTEGNPIRANGEKGDKGDTGDTGATGPEGASAPVPQLKTGASLTVTQDSEGAAIVDDAIYLSVDGGKTWTRVSGEDGEQGDKGDSFFSDVEVTDEAVIFTLADGTTTFSVPRYTGIKLNFDTQAVHLGYGNTLPVNFTAEGSDQFTADNLFIIAPDGWKTEVTLPTRAATEFILKVTAPADATSGAAEGEILVMLDNGQGSTTIGRLKVAVTNIVINGTELTAPNLEAGELAEAIGNRDDLTSVTVTGGTLDETDWAAIKQSILALQIIDLEGATYKGNDKDNWVYQIKEVMGGDALKTVKLPQGITALGEIAFYQCNALTTVTLPETLTSIGNYAFSSCYDLTSIDLPDGVTSIGSHAFNYCEALTSITLPDKVTSIGDHAFDSCYDLKSIDLPDGLESIGDDAFYSCKALTSIDLPDGLESIGENAFWECDALTSITLPDKVTSIGTFAFYGCSTLATVTCLGTTPPTTTGGNVFMNCSNLENIYVPDGSVDAYKKAAGWNEYIKFIQPIP